MKYRVYDYEVWGNKIDGYTVNSVFHTNCIANIKKDANKYDIVKALVDADFFVESALNKLLTIDVEWNEPEIIYINANDMPHCELRKE